MADLFDDKYGAPTSNYTADPVNEKRFWTGRRTSIILERWDHTAEDLETSSASLALTSYLRAGMTDEEKKKARDVF